MMEQHEQLKSKCQKNLKELKIKNNDELKDVIKDIFEKYDHQQDVLVGIYNIFLPEWDLIKSIAGFPEAGESLWRFICNKFIEFDKENHPNCFAGGAWMNSGFSCDKDLGPWDISFKNCKVTMN